VSTPTKPRVRSHRDLIVWQKGLVLVDEIYRLTEGFPSRERFEIAAQMRSAAISIPANIAEGHGRRTTRDYLRFLSIANGSLRELETYLEVCTLRRYADASQNERMLSLTGEVGRLLEGLTRALRRRLSP